MNAKLHQSIEEIVAMYVRSRAKRQSPVSTGDAIRAIRTALPDCTLNDHQLATLVARAASQNHQPVIFDEPERRDTGLTASQR